MVTRHEPADARGLFQHYLKDLVYGANDGIITTFAVVAGVAGASLSPTVVLILGFANLLGDGFSMGASNFLSIRSEEDVLHAQGRPAGEPFPFRHALATFLSFVVAGVLPLTSYVAALGERAFPTAVAITLASLFAVGSLRSLVTEARWWRSGLEMLAVGASAAAVAYVVGFWISEVTG